MRDFNRTPIDLEPVEAEIQHDYHNLRRFAAPVLAFAGVVASSLGIAFAAGSGKLNVNPDRGLRKGELVTVYGKGFAPKSTGSIVECNDAHRQPTAEVAGHPVPVSCTDPLSTIVTTSRTGKLPPTSFQIREGRTGPPAKETDSRGRNAKTDAAKYPCPPTAAQIKQGDSCVITFGDQSGDQVSHKISFAGHK